MGNSRVEFHAFCISPCHDGGECEAVLGHDDTHATMEASEQNQAVSDITMKASRQELVASDHDQNEFISSPAARYQNHENVCVVGVTGDQNNEEARDGSEDQDQNCEKNYGKNGHSKQTNENKKNKTKGRMKNK